VEMLLEILAGDRAELHETAIDTLRHLGNRLYDHLNGLGDPEADRPKNAPQIQQIVLKALNDSLASFHRLTHRETVVELILALGGPGHEITQNMINNQSSECRALAKDLLMTSRHPGVMKFVLDSLSRTYPPARVIDALQKRDDPEFVLATLRWVPRRWTNTQERNLRQIESISWIGSSDQVFTIVPEELQTAMLTFVLSTGISREEKSEIRQWLVRFGSPEARAAAAEILKELDSETVQEIVCDSLESEDPEVQAWATKQLRSQHVPDALQKLIDQLDNPSVSVQEVARQELHGFDLECLLSRQEVLSPRARGNASRLLEKVDPGYLTKLVNELHNPIRRRRLRAIRGTLAFGWNVEVTDELLGLLQDDDTLIRRAAVEVLAPVHPADVISALAALKNDPSERVRDTVEKTLAQTAAKKTVPDAPSIS